MLTDAIKKLKSEMDQNKNDTYIHAVGGFLLQHLDANPGAADRILDKDKTIKKSLDAMRKEAEKKKVGSCAVLTDQEGFAAVLKYFGLEGAVPAMPVATPAPRPIVVESKPGDDFDIKLEDLL